MEMHISYTILFSVAVLLLAYVLASHRTKAKDRDRQTKLPPGPTPLPLIGNLHQMIRSLPYRYFKDIAVKYGPVSRVYVGEVFTLIVSSVDAAKEVLMTQEKDFPQRPNRLIGQIMSSNYKGLVHAPYDEYWRRYRKITMLELLSPKRVRSFGSTREEETQNLVNFVASTQGETFDLSKKFSELISGSISRAAFGKRCRQQERFLSLLDKLIEIERSFGLIFAFPSLGFLSTLTGVKPAFLRIKRELDEILEEIIDEHMKRKEHGDDIREDIVDVLLKLRDSTDDRKESPLTLDDIKPVLLDIFLAGSETSATAINWAMAAMLKHPQVMERAQSEVRAAFRGQSTIREEGTKELSYLRSVIKETLRVYPPFPIFPRVSIHPCNILGYDIPPGTKVLINAWAIGRDPEYWKDADRFMPERFLENSTDFVGTNLEFLPFGAGRRMCPGIAFSLASIEFPLAQLLYHFDWKLPGGASPEDLDMTESYGVTCRRKQALNVVAIPISR